MSPPRGRIPLAARCRHWSRDAQALAFRHVPHVSPGPTSQMRASATSSELSTTRRTMRGKSSPKSRSCAISRSKSFKGSNALAPDSDRNTADNSSARLRDDTRNLVIPNTNYRDYLAVARPTNALREPVADEFDTTRKHETT